MMKTLLVIGDGFDEVAARIRGSEGREVVYPCRGPAHFAAVLASQPDGSIEQLDICDHGGPGFITLGGHVLFESDRDPESPLVNAELALTLRDKLTAAAQVRLLGCETGGAWRRRREGRLLLLKLAQLLNHDDAVRAHRVVFGTITGVQPSDFDEHGLLPSSALTLLFSSYSAIDHDAPDYDDRLARVAALHGDLPAAPPPAPAPAPPRRRRPTPGRELLSQLVRRFARI